MFLIKICKPLITLIFLFLRITKVHTSFDQLLICLAVLDSLYVITCIWDYSCIKVWSIHLTLYVYSFPYFWYPGKNILMSWITFLTMGIAMERYLAICR